MQIAWMAESAYISGRPALEVFFEDLQDRMTSSEIQKAHASAINERLVIFRPISNFLAHK